MKFSDAFKRACTPGRCALYVLRAALAYLAFLSLYHLTASGIQAFRNADVAEQANQTVALMTAVMLPFIFYSVVRVFLVGDTFGYGLAEGTDGREAPIKYGDAFFSPVSGIFFVTMAVLYAILPMDFGYRHLIAIPDLASFFDKTTEKLLFLWLILPMLMLLIPLAHRSARRAWQRLRARTGAPQVKLEMSGFFGFFKNETTWGGLIVRLLFVFIIYPLGSPLLTALVYSFVVPFFGTLVQQPLGTLRIVFFVLLAIAAVVLLLVLLSAPVALRKRRKLIKGIKRICKSNGYELSPIRAPYRGLFRFYEGADFCVRIGEQTYDCKLIGSKLKTGIMVFDYEGKFEVRVNLRMLRVGHVAMGGAYMHQAQLPLFKTVTDYAFESEHKKILIICPTCAVTAVIDRGSYTSIDTGSIIGEYKIYNSTGFLGALDRNCLDR